MKRSLLLCLFVLCAFGVTAQTLKIHCGPCTVAAPADRVGEMLFVDGTALRVMDATIDLATVDSITVDRTAVDDSTVIVTYEGASARVFLTADIFSRLNVSVSGANVSVVAAPDLASEVTYVLRGASDAGHFFMDGEWKARLVLDGLTLTAADSSAIEIANGKRIDVVLPAGTTTTLADRAGGTHKACFFVNGHPEFSGGGTLRLSGKTKHAFASDEYTRLKSDFGTIDITSAVGDGLHVEQYFRMDGGSVSVAGTKGDCVDISTTKDPTDEYNGQAFINAGRLTMSVAAEDVKGLKTADRLTISGGTVTATVSGNGSKGISAGMDLLICDASGTAPAISMTVTGTTYMPGNEELEAKCRGIKVKGDFTFDGGDIKISATGAKSKAISVDGRYIYKKGTLDCPVDSTW